MKERRLFAAALAFALLFSGCSGTSQSDEDNTTSAVNPTGTLASNDKPDDDAGKTDDSSVINLTADAPAAVTESVEILQEDINMLNGFSYRLFEQAVKSGEENPVISPVSAYIALGMVQNGALGDTLKELEDNLGETAVVNSLAERFFAFAESIGGSTQLNIANSVWTDKRMSVNEEFLGIVKTSYDSEVFSATLPTEETKNAVNSWISDKTNELIPQFLDEAPDDDAVMLLINTLYMNAAWQDEFDPSDTYMREFALESGEKVQTDFLNSDEMLRKYIKTENAEGVILPYDDGELSFVALKPTDGTSISDFACSLANGCRPDDATKDFMYGDLSTYIGKAEDTKIILSMPKFETSFTLEMNDVLKALGIEKAFDGETAELSGLGTADGNLYINKVLQKVKIKVNEKGTEAAAVTEIEVNGESAPMYENPIYLTFDSPYVYAVVDKNNTPLFMGVMNNPASAE